jgi:hypothetical protein
MERPNMLKSDQDKTTDPIAADRARRRQDIRQSIMWRRIKIVILGIVVLNAVSSLSATRASETVIPTHEPNVRFYLLKKEGTANKPILTYRREGSSGASYGKRQFDCKRVLTRYLAYGDTPDMADAGYPEPTMYPLVERSSAWYLGTYACAK